MGKFKPVATLVIALMLSFMLVSAETELISVEQYPSSLTIFWNNLLHNLNLEPFTVVGDARRCSSSPSYSWSVAEGKTLSGSQGVLSGEVGTCPDGGLYDTWTNGWTSWMERKSVLGYACGTGPCNIELYCCDHPEPLTVQDCLLWYSSVAIKTASCVSWNNGYKCTTDYGTESGMPYYTNSFKYCSSATSIDCYYYSGSGSTCTERTYPAVATCPASYEGHTLYSSESVCESNIEFPCTPDCSCASNTCTGSTCSDGCGDACAGTKDCEGEGDGETPTCSDGQQNGDETGVDCGGSCNACSGGGGDDGEGTGGVGGEVTDVRVLNIELPEPDTLRVRDEVGSDYDFKVTIKNDANEQKIVRVEAGFYTPSYAKDVAKLYSTFPIFSVTPLANCVDTEEFVKTVEVSLEPLEEKTITITQKPLPAYVTLPIGEYQLDGINLVPFLGVFKHYGENACCKKLADFEDCATGTGGYLDSKYNNQFSLPDRKTIYKKNIVCGGEIYGVVDYNFFGADTLTINRDYNDCISFEFYTQDGDLDEEATEEYKQRVQGGAYSELVKVSLTREEISKATNTALLLSSCLESDECLPRENYTESCISINSLRDDGTLTSAKTDSFFEEAKSKINGGIKGGAIGGTVGILGCGGVLIAAGVTAPATFGASLAGGATVCSALIGGGALVGAGVGVAFTGVDKDDPLIKELNAENDNAVGICTAEEGAFDLGSWISKIGKSIKITGNETTDGFLVLGGGVLLLIILLSVLGGKK